MKEEIISKRLDGKDLINIGIFSAIYAFIVCVVAIMGMIPIFLILLSIVAPILGGIPYMLFLTKVKKFGMITIMGLLMGILMILTGMGYAPLLTGLVAGLIADIVYTRGGFSTVKSAILASGIFSLWTWGNYYELFFHTEAYWSTRQDFGQSYIDAVNSLLPSWMCPVLLLLEFVSGIIGGFLGKALLKKHFKRAGIA